MLTTEESADAGAPAAAPKRLHGSRSLVALAAALPAASYLLYVAHYAVNVPRGDDWNMIPVAATARFRPLSLTELWVQYTSTRLFVLKFAFAASGHFDHLNLWHFQLFGAATYVMSFVLLLLAFRRYIRRPLSVLAALALGVVWFSVADVENPLWAFQVGWYLVVFFFVVMTYCLTARRTHSSLWFAAAIVAAVLASLTWVQGFAVWAVGLICILWASPWGRRTYYEIAIWLGAAALTAAVYAHNFDLTVSKAVCVGEGGKPESCGFAYGLSHPVQLGKFLAALAGNVVPTLRGTHVGAHEVLGAVIWIVAGFVIVQSVRSRRSQTNPLPVAIIAFALQFDLMIALSRFGRGATGASQNYYTMPNIILLFGIVVYAFGHIPDFRSVRERGNRRSAFNAVAFAVFACFLVFQFVCATDFGLDLGRAEKDYDVWVARVMTNLDRLPTKSRDCYMTTAVPGPGAAFLRTERSLAEQYRLSLFSGPIDEYRRLGPPVILECDKPTGPDPS
jgi:hypothetical protein